MLRNFRKIFFGGYILLFISLLPSAFSNLLTKYSYFFRMEYLATRLDDLHDRTNNNLFTLMMLEQKVGGTAVVAAVQQQPQRGLPTQVSLPLSPRYGMPTPAGSHLTPSAAMVVSTATPKVSTGESGDERRFSGDISAMSPSSAVDVTGVVLGAAPSTDDVGHGSGYHLNIDDYSKPRRIDRNRPQDRRRSAAAGSGAAAVARHQLLGAEDSPTTSLSRIGSFSRTQTWASGMGDLVSCEDLTRMDYGSMAGGVENRPVEFISGDDGDEEEERK